MGLKRIHIIVLAALCAIAAVILPIALMLHLSWISALRREERALQAFAEQGNSQAELLYGQARDVLLTLARADIRPCSEQHVALMREIVMTTKAVNEIGYFKDGRIVCSSWGPVEPPIAREPVDYVTDDGIAVTVRMQPLVSRFKAMMALHFRDHNVLIDPSRLTDVAIDADTRLVIASAGGVLVTAQGETDSNLVSSLLRQPRSGIDDDHVFATVRSKNWIAIAISPRARIVQALREEQWLLLPVAALMAISLVALIIWFARRRLSPLGELQLAIRNREFVAHYQPIIDIETGVCVGAEALARWRRPDGTAVRPDLFIVLAEENGLIGALTDLMVETVIRDLAAVLVADRSLHIALNLSAEDLVSGRILAFIQQAVAGTGIRTEQLWLEATERGFVDIEAARATLIEARKLGHSVAIDDFGTGYSSLQYLQRLPLDALKIDKAFVETIGRNAATSAVIGHIIDMAKTLDLHIVAEGIETEEQLAYLRGRGVRFGQGWLFSKPLPARDFIAFHRRRRHEYGSGPELIRRAVS
ncbi:EAL domain-containing protein [Bosea thiooxidans]|nr:EAL domain-containing protein [Bosea sp. (in: a-proteobacteria)]